MNRLPYYSPNPLVYRERDRTVNQLESDYDPRIINQWQTVLFIQKIVPIFLVILTLFTFAAFQTFGNRRFGFIDLQVIYTLIAFANILSIPYTLMVFRCPRCHLYVGGQTDPRKPHRFYHAFPNFRIRQCPHCLAQLR